jgi:serine/threonine-protein kinase
MPKQLTKVGKYVIVGKMAKGGMGAVYKAKHPTLKRYVILKQLTLRSGSGIGERFKREAQLMIDFRHENIVPVYDHFRSGSSYYIVMEFVDGTSLDKLIAARGHLSNEAALLVFAEVCKGLKYAHGKGVIHRDIKPANILLSREGEVKIVDFGIATTKESEQDGLTQAGMTLGTPAYMSPEQIADSRSVDIRSDVYSMGVMLYEMLTGEKPFPGDFTPDAIDRINRGAYKNPKRLNQEIPGFLVQLIKKMMHHRAKRRFVDLHHVLQRLTKVTRRYRTQKSVRSAIKRYLQGSEITAPAAFAIVGSRVGMRPILKLTIGIALFLVIVVGGIYSYLRGYYHEYVRGRDYGRIEVRSLIPEDYYKRIGLVYAYTRLTRIDVPPPAAETEDEDRAIFKLFKTAPQQTKSFRLMPRMTLPFIPVRDDEGTGNVRPDGLQLTTGGRYLHAGYYRIETYIENQKYYGTLYLNPRAIQREQVDTVDGRVLQFRLQESDSRPIDLGIEVRDSETGDSLYGITDISIYLKDSDRWLDWKKYRRNDRLWRYLQGHLLSGKSYRFLFSAPSYFEERIELFVEPDIDAAMIEVDLVRKPGLLLVRSNQEGLDLLIDNRRESYLGGQSKDFVRFGSTIVGDRTFELGEGSYVLTVMKSGKNVKNFQFTVRPGRTTAVRVIYDTESREITLE